jgi:hypothetical protein
MPKTAAIPPGQARAFIRPWRVALDEPEDHRETAAR